MKRRAELENIVDGGDDLGLSKGAPVPIPRQARSYASPLVIHPLTRSFHRGTRRQTLPPRGGFDPVFFPLPVHAPTVSTSPVESPLWMIVPVLVQRYLPHGMLPAKYIPTVSAVMPPFEEAEGSLAHRRIADCGIGVKFPMAARGWACDFGEIGGRHGLL